MRTFDRDCRGTADECVIHSQPGHGAQCSGRACAVPAIDEKLSRDSVRFASRVTLLIARGAQNLTGDATAKLALFQALMPLRKANHEE